MVVKEKIDIDKLNLEECMRVIEDNEKDHDTCSERPCTKCHCSQDNYVGKIGNCMSIRQRVFKKALEFINEVNKPKETKCQEVNCKCSECSQLNKEMLDKGYFFCLHWHNFTRPDAYCSFAEIHKQEEEE